MVVDPDKACRPWTKNAGCAKGDARTMHQNPPCKDRSKDGNSCPRGKGCPSPRHRMDGYIVAKAAVAKANADKKASAAAAEPPTGKAAAKTDPPKGKNDGHLFAALQLAPCAGQAVGRPSADSCRPARADHRAGLPFCPPQGVTSRRKAGCQGLDLL